MRKKQDVSVLKRYFNQGWLEQKYYCSEGYVQLFGADERLVAGELFYEDFLRWARCRFSAIDPEKPKVDGGQLKNDWLCFAAAERFRRALGKVSKECVPVVYKIVLEEQDIRPPAGMTAREKLYFSDEIKKILCRGLDALCVFYAARGGFCEGDVF